MKYRTCPTSRSYPVVGRVRVAVGRLKCLLRQGDLDHRIAYYAPATSGDEHTGSRKRAAAMVRNRRRHVRVVEEHPHRDLGT